MSKDESNPLHKLLNADREAAAAIAREEKLRSKRLQEAENAAQEIYETRRAEEEAKFQQELKNTDGEGSEKLSQLMASIAAEKKQQTESFDAAKGAVIDTLLHFVTTCAVTVNENEREAFLAIQREENNA